MPKLLVFDEEATANRTWIKQLQDQLADTGVRLRQASNVAVLQSALDDVEDGSALVVLVDASGARAPRIEFLSAVQAQHPELRALVVVDPEMTNSDSLQNLLASSSVDFVRTPADIREVSQRIRKLVGSAAPTGIRAADARPTAVRKDFPARRRVRAIRRVPQSRAPAGSDLTRHLVANLRNPNGRLDAKKIAALFGLPLAEVARIIDRQLSPVHKTPDAPSLQKSLALFERIAAALLPLAGSGQGLRMWLNAPNPDLEGYLPIELLKRGQGEIVAELLEDALTGQPG